MGRKGEKRGHADKEIESGTTLCWNWFVKTVAGSNIDKSAKASGKWVTELKTNTRMHMTWKTNGQNLFMKRQQ